MTRVSPAYKKPLRMPNKVPRMSKKGLATALAVLFAPSFQLKSLPVSRSVLGRPCAGADGIRRADAFRGGGDNHRWAVPANHSGTTRPPGRNRHTPGRRRRSRRRASADCLRGRRVRRYSSGRCFLGDRAYSRFLLLFFPG